MNEIQMILITAIITSCVSDEHEKILKNVRCAGMCQVLTGMKVYISELPRGGYR
jgi:hypothetical protein